MRPSYDTDLTDEQWLKISSFYPQANHRGRPRTIDVREITNAILSSLSGRASFRTTIHPKIVKLCLMGIRDRVMVSEFLVCYSKVEGGLQNKTDNSWQKSIKSRKVPLPAHRFYGGVSLTKIVQ